MTDNLSKKAIGQCTTETGLPNEVLTRRTLLRGVLTAGCGLLVPAALMGCDSRKEATDNEAGNEGTPMADPGTSALPEATPGGSPGGDQAAPAPAAKVSQASVQYQMQPKGDQKCGNCKYFIAESNACQLVEGEISPEAWCVLWAKGDVSRRDPRDGRRARQFA
jgi:hypothetical protein